MLHLPLQFRGWVASEDEVDHKKPSNSDETGPGERKREGDHRLKEYCLRLYNFKSVLDMGCSQVMCICV